MENNIAIEFKNVSKIYKLKRKDKMADKGQKMQYFYALKDFKFSKTLFQLDLTNAEGKHKLLIL